MKPGQRGRAPRPEPASTARSSGARASTRRLLDDRAGRRAMTPGRAGECPGGFPRSRWSSSTAGVSRRRGPETRSARLRRLSSTGSGSAIRTPPCRPAGATWAFPTARWATPRSGTSTSAPESIVKQDLTRIDDAIADGSFFENPALKAACEAARAGPRGRLHLMGLVSDGGVHSGWEHIEACVELAAREGVPDLVVPRVHRRPRHPAHGGRRVPARARALAAARGTDRNGERPLLRDGPRPPLESDPARLRRDRPRARAAGRERRGGHRGVATDATRPTSSCARP